MATSCSFCLIIHYVFGIDSISKNWSAIVFGLPGHGSDPTGFCTLVF